MSFYNYTTSNDSNIAKCRSTKHGHRNSYPASAVVVVAYGPRSRLLLSQAAGAHVTTTASPNKMPDGTSKIDYMKKLGADEARQA